MPEYPEITPETPVVKPAQDEKVYSKLWLSKLEVHGEEGPLSPVSIRIDLVPSNGAEILKEPITSAIIPDAFKLASEDPEFAQVLGGVIMMANKYKGGIKVEIKEEEFPQEEPPKEEPPQEELPPVEPPQEEIL